MSQNINKKNDIKNNINLPQLMVYNEHLKCILFGSFVKILDNPGSCCRM